MKVLFLVQHRFNRSPGQRYRHEQYIDFLEEKGIQCTFSPLIKTKLEDELFYGGGQTRRKIMVGLKALGRRLKDMIRVSDFDAVYIYRDAFFFGTFFEKYIYNKKIPILYDFDDAIWLMDKNPNQGIFNKLKNPAKTASILKLSSHAIVGNAYLAAYARQYQPNVSIIPSTINFSSYNTEIGRVPAQRICIGWTGSFSTIKHFETVIPALKQIKAKYADQVYFKLIGEPDYQCEELDLKGTAWSAETEAQDLGELTIGLMPLPDNEWTQGKCAMKGLQYMALGIPTIMSPVGMNKDLIQDGENGLLASDQEEWVLKISSLIDDQALRSKMGAAGLQTVKDSFSQEANKEKWLAAFRKTTTA